MKKSLLPLVQITGHNLRWSAIERKSTLGRLYAMYHSFSLPFIFGTISPSMRDSRLAIRLCYSNLGQESNLPPIYLRTKMISKNPVAAAHVFDHVMRAFFSIICGIPLDDFTGKRAKVDRLLSVAQDDYVGAFGRLHAAIVLLKLKVHHRCISIFIYLVNLIISYSRNGCMTISYERRLQPQLMI